MPDCFTCKEKRKELDKVIAEAKAYAIAHEVTIPVYKITKEGGATCYGYLKIGEKPVGTLIDNISPY